MITAALFVLTAGAATLLRQSLTGGVNVFHGAGTVAVNVGGAFLLGLAQGLDTELLTVVGTGGLGAFTTFSTMALDLTTADRRTAAVYLAATVVAGLLAAKAGIELAG